MPYTLFHSGPGSPICLSPPRLHIISAISLYTALLYTGKSQGDRLYYRRTPSDGWRRLDRPDTELKAYAELNKIIDSYR